MENSHLGHCDGGRIRLCSRGIRWMHTLRKLPTTEPKTKKTNAQNTSGAPVQNSSRKSSIAVNVCGKCVAHDFHRSRLAGPDFQCLHPLPKQHAQSIGSAASGRLRL